MYVDDEGVEWEREVTHFGAILKLACPEGKYVSHLIRTGDGNIRYLLPGPGNRQLPWPPDPTSTEYGEPCHCEDCKGRTVGGKVGDLRNAVNELHAVATANEDTYFLDYLEV
jgi:hypothetical protein